VTRLLLLKNRPFFPNIAQNGALVNKNFCPKKYIFGKNQGFLRQKVSLSTGFITVTLWKKMWPNH
jgi:hypothetical protein